ERSKVLELDRQLAEGLAQDHGLVREVVLLMKRVLKRMDLTAKSFFALIDRDSCFAGSLLELALASDRAYMLVDDAVAVQLSSMNFGPLPTSNGLTRLQGRFLGDPSLAEALQTRSEPLTGEEAEAEGL